MADNLNKLNDRKNIIENLISKIQDVVKKIDDELEQ